CCFSGRRRLRRQKRDWSSDLCSCDLWAHDVAEGLAQVIVMFDPGHMIIGGGISQQGGFLLDIIVRHIKTFLPPDFLKTEFKIAELFNDAALYGAVSLFMQPDK